MCLIALSNTGFCELPMDFWEQACVANPHGFGLMFHCGQQLQVRRWLKYDAAFISEQLHACPAETRVAIHLREATAGERGGRNLHPHLSVLDERGFSVAVMHNGTLSKLPARHFSGPSDSALFAQEWLPRQVAGAPLQWHQAEHLQAIEAFAGTRNRFVLLDSQGTWRVVGAHEGFDVGGTWLSNPRAKAWLSREASSVPPVQLTL